MNELSPLEMVNEIKKILDAYGIYIRMDQPIDVWVEKVLECMWCMMGDLKEQDELLTTLFEEVEND